MFRNSGSFMYEAAAIGHTDLRQARLVERCAVGHDSVETQDVGDDRMLANDAELLLMDEPFTALDAQTREIMQRELLRIRDEHLPHAERKTMVFETHSIDEAVFLSDRVVVISARPGMIKEVFVKPLPRPPTEEIRSSPEFLSARDHLWGLIKADAAKAMVERQP